MSDHANNSESPDMAALSEVRDGLLGHFRRFTAGEVDADSCGKVGFLGFSAAYVVAVRHSIDRAAA
jgi:hypothetical protein